MLAKYYEVSTDYIHGESDGIFPFVVDYSKVINPVEVLPVIGSMILHVHNIEEDTNWKIFDYETWKGFNAADVRLLLEFFELLNTNRKEGD